MEMNQESTGIHQILLKLLDGTHRFLNFTTPIITTHSLKQRIQTLTFVPSHHQLLLLLGQSNCPPALLTDDHKTLNLSPSSGPHCKTQDLDGNSRFPLVVHLLLRLRGGKGGFGSLLRGAATKAGQKKTNNFDACRDMSGRRLRHVNAEKKLEEWRAEAEERKLEKIAEEFIKKKAKEMVKNGKGKGGVDTDKYVLKYREDSAKCMQEVERSVRESLKGLVSSSTKKKKRASKGNESDAKRFKICRFGKRKVAGSDSEDDSDEDEDENNKSVVIDKGDQSDSSKEAEGSSDSVTEARRDAISSDTGPSESSSEEEKDNTVKEGRESGESEVDLVEAATVIELELGTLEEKTLQDGDKLSLQASVVGIGTIHAKKEPSDKSCLSDAGGRVSQAPTQSISGEDEASAVVASNDSISNLAMHDEVVTTINAEALNLEKPINLEEINSAAELEVLGLERLKSELQARGLKCGGTLQERAARLFLLKTTPVEKLPKKLLAKK
ncbi:uncharacterized protein [Coffea arabica]|uniref:Uncharacterized protein isoform X1 n=1 Tax=Coffea arabica TaxID=13443 RepID=A0ABM4WZZ3_COFAR|nr:replication stress response regulator SDE2 isoform X1 [Coffea arabica]